MFAKQANNWVFLNIIPFIDNHKIRAKKVVLELFELLLTQRDDINIISLTRTIKRQNRKFIVVFSVNLCFLLLSFWGFLILLFLICFFRHFAIPISIDYQHVTSNQ